MDLRSAQSIEVLKVENQRTPLVRVHPVRMAIHQDRFLNVDSLDPHFERDEKAFHRPTNVQASFRFQRRLELDGTLKHAGRFHKLGGDGC
jgi:hypothetical protein